MIIVLRFLLNVSTIQFFLNISVVSTRCLMHGITFLICTSLQEFFERLFNEWKQGLVDMTELYKRKENMKSMFATLKWCARYFSPCSSCARRSFHKMFLI